MANRREMLLSGAALAAALTGAASAAPVRKPQCTSDPSVGDLTPEPIPSQVPVQEGWLELPGARLYYWDTGGPDKNNGEPIVLLHALTGSAATWEYQQPVFAKAGYRVIGYSRRGYYKSAAVDPNNMGYAIDDLHFLIESLKLSKVHLLGTAAGGGPAVEYALAHPERVRSLILACTNAGVRDPEFIAQINSLRVKGFLEMSTMFKELSPSYRVANPEGVKRWEELESKSLVAGRVPETTRTPTTWARLKDMKTPTLHIVGAADLYVPPALIRTYVQNVPGTEMVVMPEVGHSAYWEAPTLFNKTVLDFVKRHHG